MNGRRTAFTGRRSKKAAKNAESQAVKREVESDGSCNVCGGIHFGSCRCPFKSESSKENCENKGNLSDV